MDNRFDFRVSGILKNIPANSHLRFNFAVPFSIIKEYDRPIEGWATYFANTYILLDQHADVEALNDKIANVIKKHDPETLAVLSLQPISRIHLYSGDIMGFGGAGDIRYVIIFSIIAMFILMMACINFMNLTTARSGDRAREIGMRKVVGASRRALIRQFFGESIILSFIALLLSIVLITLLLPVFNSISGKELAFQFSSNSTVYLGLIGITLITGIVAGTYPALFLSAFKPVHVLKSGLKPGSRNSRFRRILVIFQFILTTALLIGTIVVYRQLNFIRNQKLGYEKEHLLYLRLPGDIRTKTELFKNEFIKIPNVQSASATSDDLAGLHASIIFAEWEGRNSDDQFALQLFWADPDFLNTFQIEMADGRFFSKEFTADTANSIIMNEAAIRAMGMDSPIGKRVFEKSNIIGVIKDFHYTSLHQPIGPLVIIYSPEQFQFLFIKITGENVPKTIRAMEQSWNTLAGAIPFDFHFLDETIDDMYQADQRFGKIINTFTILALFIACLGVFGMASFMAEQRTKEIGIRKVLGASVPGIVLLLSKEFIKWVLIDNLITWPLAWYVMNRWLQGFAYETKLGLEIFVFSAVLALGISLLTVSYQAIKAALTNPVESLRYE